MKKIFSLMILGLVLALAACGKKSSGSNNNNTAYQAPQYAPPSTDGWHNGYVPPGNCGQASTLPSQCWGTYNGCSYCGNQWYCGYNSTYWIFSAFQTSSCSGGATYIPIDDDAWTGDDDDYVSDSDDDDDDDDDNNNTGSNNYGGWKKMWGIMGNSENRYITVKIPKGGMHYISFKGDYTGKKQDEEKLQVMFSGGNVHHIKDLEQKHTGSGEKTKSCKVNVNFKLMGGETYKIILKGNKDSVNNTYLRLTNYWPNDISTLCN